MQNKLFPILLSLPFVFLFSGCQNQTVENASITFEPVSSNSSRHSIMESSSSEDSSAQEEVSPLHKIMKEYYNGVFEEFGYSLDQYTCSPIGREDVPGKVFLYYNNNIPQVKGMTMPYVYQNNEEPKYIILYQTEKGENTLITLDYSQSETEPVVTTESKQSDPIDFHALLESSLLNQTSNEIKNSEDAINEQPPMGRQIIPLTRKELDEMGKEEFDVQISASAEEFPIDPNGFDSPSMGHLDIIKEGSVPMLKEPSPWNFGDIPIYYYNVVWSPLECLTGAYFYEVYYVQDTDLYVYRDCDISEYKDKSFYDAVLRDQFEPYTYGIPIFYFQVFRRSDFESPNAWIDAAGKQIQASSLPVWYEDGDIVAVDMTGYTFPNGFKAFLEEYQEKNILTREGYDYTWIIKRNELWSRPPKSIFASLQ